MINRLWRNMIIRIANQSIFFKITVLFEAIMVFTIVVVASFINTNYASTLKQKEIALGTTELEKFENYMNEKYNRVYSLANYIHSSQISRIISDISEDSKSAYKIDYINSVKIFSQGIFSADSDISDVILVTTNKVVYSNSAQGYSNVKPSYDFMENRYVKELLDSDEDMQIVLEKPVNYTLKNREAVISFLGKVYDSSKFPKKKLVGVYIINIPYHNIEKNLSVNQGTKGNIVLLNNKDIILFSSNINQCEKKFEYQQYKIKHNKTDDFLEIWDVGISGLKVAYIFQGKQLYSEIYKNMHKTYVIIAIAFVITLLWSWFVCRLFNKRVKILTSSMRYVQKGDFSHRIPVKTQDEIGVLSEAFNNMCEKLNDYIAKVYQSEIRLKNAEVNALQTQINPHFLYNTLESIKAEALQNNDFKTVEMIALLGNLFHWSSKTGDKIVSLEDEIDYINSYLELQRFRFQNNLNVIIQIEDELLDFGVPKLILQPIVENTIRHGLKLVEKPGVITIIANEKPDHILEITIADNGEGMTEERLLEIRSDLMKEMDQDDFQSIGIQNVHQRLRLMFGNKYGLSVSSLAGEGTAIKFILPAMPKEEMDKIV